MEKKTSKADLLSVVVPVYNEQNGILIFYQALTTALKEAGVQLEIIFINDGSTDDSWDILKGLHARDSRVKLIDLSRNFGHQSALTAGIECARGDAVVLMDMDMEDLPDTILEFLLKWREGYEIVYAIRDRRQVSPVMKILYKLFHWLNALVSDIQMGAAGIFSLMDRRVVDQFKKFPEKDRYIPGLRAWVGFKQIGVKSDRGARYDGRSRVGVIRLIKLAGDSIFSFSTLPLRFAVFFGLFFSFLSFCLVGAIIWIKFFTNLAIPGWTSILSAVMLIGGIQLICMGFQGEYLIRVFNEVKNRPNYIVRESLGFDTKG
jgi:glycosyltransferase involved in cell wall biosynthesis